jgi:uncharacterized protein
MSGTHESDVTDDDPWRELYPLHAAADAGQLEALEQLLSDYDANALDEAGWTPLMWARHDNVVIRLLDAGAMPEYATAAGESVLMALARRATPSALRALVGRAALDVNASDARGNTALMEAAAAGAAENVRELLVLGADAAARSVDGGSAESAAHEAGFVSLADEIRAWTSAPQSRRL